GDLEWLKDEDRAEAPAHDPAHESAAPEPAVPHAVPAGETVPGDPPKVAQAQQRGAPDLGWASDSSEAPDAVATPREPDAQERAPTRAPEPWSEPAPDRDAVGPARALLIGALGV